MSLGKVKVLPRINLHVQHFKDKVLCNPCSSFNQVWVIDMAVLTVPSPAWCRVGEALFSCCLVILYLYVCNLSQRMQKNNK